MIFKVNDEKFNDVFLDLCKQELKRKQGKSLDFYDLANLIDKSLKQTDDKESKTKARHVTFKEDYGKKKGNFRSYNGFKKRRRRRGT